jgi:hypothetical protein
MYKLFKSSNTFSGFEELYTVRAFISNADKHNRIKLRTFNNKKKIRSIIWTAINLNCWNNEHEISEQQFYAGKYHLFYAVWCCDAQISSYSIIIWWKIAKTLTFMSISNSINHDHLQETDRTDLMDLMCIEIFIRVHKCLYEYWFTILKASLHVNFGK